MLESAMGLPITDTRKEHMSVEYKNYITELKTGKTDEEKAERLSAPLFFGTGSPDSHFFHKNGPIGPNFAPAMQ